MSVYQFDPAMRPDSEFEPGHIRHLSVGRRGRLLDHRRTPVTVLEIRPKTGTFIVRLDAFEDEGATWEVPLENIKHYQFRPDGHAADRQTLAKCEQAIAKFNRKVCIPCDPAAAESTRRRVAEFKDSAASWLRANSEFLRQRGILSVSDSRIGDTRLRRDLMTYMQSVQLDRMDNAFAERFVRNPSSGDLVKGHRIVIAELGLVPYEGKVIRDPAIFEGEWSKHRRARHVMVRAGFMQALFSELGTSHVTLYRGFASQDQFCPPRNETFLSATFSREVAESHFNSPGECRVRALLQQTIPIARIFMTYHETDAMNERYKEAEAALFWEEGNSTF